MKSGSGLSDRDEGDHPSALVKCIRSAGIHFNLNLDYKKFQEH